MSLARRGSFSVGVAVWACLVARSDAFVPDPGLHSLEMPLPAETRVRPVESARLEDVAPAGAAVPGPGWSARLDPRTGTVRAAWGGDLLLAGGVRDERQAGELARWFLLEHGDLLGTRPENLELRNVRHAAGKYAVHFRQVVGGLVVHGAGAFAVLGESGRLAAFGSTFFPGGEEVREVPAVSATDAIEAAAAALGTAPRADRPVRAELVRVPAPSGELLVPVPAWKVTFESHRPPGKWETFVDAHLGTILGRTNLYRFVDVIGTVEEVVRETGSCDPPTTRPASNLEVRVTGGNAGLTDATGSFDIPHGGALPVTVTAELRGPFVDVDRAPEIVPDAAFLGPATPGIPVSISWDDTNSRRDERDVFFHVERSHAFITALDPTLTGLDTPVVASVGRIDFLCPGNAWWDGVALGFCETNGTFSNTGEIDTIVQHEYGHAVSDKIYARNGTALGSRPLSEGNSDVFANFLSRTSIIGRGWFVGNCTDGIRDSDNSLQYPDDLQGGTGHFDGQIIAGFHWDLWQSLLSNLPPAAADSVAGHLWYLARDLGTPQDLPDQVLWTFLADDDDADLANGTPNFAHICLGAANHGFTCPQDPARVLITHERLPHALSGSQGFDVVATIAGTEAPVDPASMIVEYRVNGGPFSVLPLAPTGIPDEYSAHIPPQGPMSEIEYYLFAADLEGRTSTDPVDAPASLHAFDIAWVYDGLESGGPGWTVGLPGDDAATGQWALFDPVGTLAQPEDDRSPGPANVLCFVTGQCAVGHGLCVEGCTLGCNDVDDGATTLVSPVYDLTGAAAARLKYDRWYSNDLAAAPGEDFWVVDVSNDGGATWTNLESTNESDASWRTRAVDLVALFGAPAQVRVRFVASDLGDPSLVEAAVDELRILASFGSVGAGEPVRAPPALSLAQNTPNPFRPATQIEYSLPRRAGVHLEVYDVRGRLVRTLARGIREAGPHRVVWDGRDSRGRSVGAGIYFCRLTTPSGALTRKMTVLE